VRLFIGVELNDQVRDAAAQIAESLKRELGTRVDARWIPAANLHITLWFIGEIEDHRSQDLLRILNRPFDEPAFDIDVSGLGMFPPSGAPRVISLGVRSGGLPPPALGTGSAPCAVRLQAERRPYSTSDDCA
jgi:2'-5' RNA ligase